MLAAVRQKLGQSSRLSCRRLTTASLAGAESSSAVNVAPVAYPAQGLSKPEGPLKAISIAQPVYVPMSSLIRPAKGDNPSDRLATLDPFVFAAPIRRDILHLCVVHYLDSLRQGSANTKTRGEVRGSGRKIRRQKGSGMARLGDGQSPMLRGGGVAFGPRPRSFATKLPRKVIEMGMRVALSARLKERGLRIVESLDWPGNKTKNMLERVEELGWGKTLFVSGQPDVPLGLQLASSNLRRLDTTTVQELNVYDLVKWPQVVLDVEAVEWLEEKLGKRSVVDNDGDSSA
ncbi:ribosomal protein L4 [Dentipellis sp. KUC8613]|nr:ribosomal protein L4 [Dentipellis sp. KUC8613]